MKGGKQQGGLNNGPHYKPPGELETAQRISCPSLAFLHPHREHAPAGLVCWTCRVLLIDRPLPGSKELGGRETNKVRKHPATLCGACGCGCMVEGFQRCVLVEKCFSLLAVVISSLICFIVRYLVCKLAYSASWLHSLFLAVQFVVGKSQTDRLNTCPSFNLVLSVIAMNLTPDMQSLESFSRHELNSEFSLQWPVWKAFSSR